MLFIFAVFQQGCKITKVKGISGLIIAAMDLSGFNVGLSGLNY
jgi:hypothetical protein